ncbi:Cytochrome c-552 [Alteripontixanthobacter maritimus]|uniref:Cytochrome c-552 n=1 Tax=Alteripontixanthobacter maritimus TaxID=2161824 RepID=A0A369QC95_9SPHN|nr:cytochrome c family protein [Alteripontixanthobacter maritimus]RDC60529.1 Cytochrome c-552 [Alteripontixanthobacter maritimus]
MGDRTNTIFGWVLFAGIIMLGLSAISSRWFHGGSPERPEQMGYAIEGVAEEGGDSGPDIGTLLAAATPEAGEKIFAKCIACHSIESGGPTGIGPNLYGVLGTPIGKHAAGFAYSSALVDVGGSWDYEAMDAWLKSPRGFANGTKMSFAGLGSAEDRANVIAYLHANGGGPAFPEPAAPEVTEEGDTAADAPGAGPGPVEGAEAGAAESAGGASMDQPVAGGGATANSGGAKIGGR